MALTFAGAGVLVLGAILTGVAYVQPSPYSFQDLSDYQTRHDALLGVGISFMICGAGLTTIGAIDWMRASQPR